MTSEIKALATNSFGSCHGDDIFSTWWSSSARDRKRYTQALSVSERDPLGYISYEKST
jgi:hypothetical protein